ncbi:DUF551 domain-containing protein [Acinetobacter pseudolwoffii]|uniref:DUF551 domain-containing protein n=1 Tax=Acinetobacter pseudolwoffii TaxID=2053287 RepID=A0A2H9YS46_9GAMM|nr:DUF551 domain-containing protein [Acinetobacter pseudolwoffii]PJO75466.1 hypothetical protein CWI32_08005 [Acinetobacter pseudolwoffii]
MDIQKEREAFEQHLTDTGLVEFAGYGFAVDECDEYLHEPTQVAWDSWLIGLNRTKAQAVPEWISVEDKLPEIGVYVMVFLEKQGHNPTAYNFCQYTKFGFHLSNVTHWAPLPEPPETQEPAND